MKAFVYTQYGSPDVLHMQEVARPAPADNQVLIKLVAVSINGSDREGLVGKPLYARIGGLSTVDRQILGSDVAGRVVSVGKNIHEFQVGDEVFGELPGYHGGFAEYACASENTLAHKPAGLSFEQAASIPQAGVIAFQGIRRRGQVRAGQKVLINGAGGSAGMFAVQLARLAGAEVTGVDRADKFDFMRSLGADHVIDYTRRNFTRDRNHYDLILDVIAHRSAFAYARALRPGGTYYVVGGSVATLLQVLFLGPLISRATGKHVRVLAVPQNRVDLLAITELCLAGQVTPVIDRIFPFREVPEAMRYVGEGHSQGKVVVTLEDGRQT